MNYSQSISRINFEIMYRVAMKRIANNLSPEQLSFLIGKPDNYVSELEVFPAAFYTNEDLVCIAMAMEELNSDSYYPFAYDGTIVEVQLDKKYCNGSCKYTGAIGTQGDSLQPYFELNDTTEAVQENPENAAIEFALVRDAVQLLLRVGYFYEARLASEVYIAIKFFLARKLNPNSLKRVFENFCNMPNKLLRMVELQNNRFGYQQP